MNLVSTGNKVRSNAATLIIELVTTVWFGTFTLLRLVDTSNVDQLATMVCCFRLLTVPYLSRS